MDGEGRESEADVDSDGPPQLTEYAELHGCSCKVGQGDLEDLLARAGLAGEQEGLLFGVGEDAAATPLDNGRALVSTIDFFTPIVDDPYEFGRIAACNAASDAFATGATDDLRLLVVLGLPRAVTDCAADVLAGMVDVTEEMHGVVAGGHTILNPWPLAGGAVTATAAQSSLLTAQDADPGDTLYLTKPLGTQPAMGALRVSHGEFADAVRGASERSVEDVGSDALALMTTPNRAAALAARDLASAATDITGFGLLGQVDVLASRSGVGAEVTRIPVIAGTPPLSRLFGYGLEDGESAETSGGLLLSVPGDRTDDLEAALAAADVPCWQVGHITKGTGARIVDPELVEVEVDDL